MIELKHNPISSQMEVSFMFCPRWALSVPSVCVLTFLFFQSLSLSSYIFPLSFTPLKPWWCSLKPTPSAGRRAFHIVSVSWAAVHWSRSTLRLKKWRCIASFTLCAPLLFSSSMSVAYSRFAHIVQITNRNCRFLSSC